MGKASAPPAPNYTQAAQQQGVSNVETAYAQNVLNNPNMTTPYGSSTYTPGAQIGTNPDGSPIYGPGSEVQTLSPAQQGLLNSSNQAKQTSLNILNQDAPNIQNALLQPFGYSQAVPQGGYLPGTGPTQSMQYGIGATGPIQGQINTAGVSPVPQAGQGFLNQVEQAQYAQGAQFLNPQFQQAQTALTGQLANQGIMPGSAAYNTAVNNLALQQTGAYQNLINNSITSGQQAAQGLFGMQLAGNQTGFGEAQQSGQFANAAQSQQVQELLAQMQAANAAVGSQASIASNEAQLAAQEQAQGYQQYATNRTMPINMISALLNGSQVTNPTFNAYSPTAIQTTPIMQGAIAQGQANAAGASANAGKMGSGLGALGTIGAAAVPPGW
jgi:hypothetical protein